MTDWGDASLNEQARRQTWPAPPAPPTAVTAVRRVPRPQPADDPPLARPDTGARLIPGAGGGT
jgi:hypothetical protein